MKKNSKVLVVDDDPFILHLVQAMLKPLGYQLQSADNGEAALELMEKRNNDFDLLLTDIAMPKMNGYKLAQSVKEKYPAVKVILMSGQFRPSSDDSVDSHALDFLAKPFTLDELKETIERTFC